MVGKLYLVATPIGNLDDISFRAVEILKFVDLIACEDTRHSGKLLKHLEVSKPLFSYHDHNKYDGANVLIDRLQRGLNIALISDAGTPAISDPGEVLVRLCHEHGIDVTSIPGPVAFVQALVLSGFNTRRFIFDGFLPTANRERKAYLREIENETRTIILYEAPHRLLATLEDLSDYLGDRQITLARELTKRYETIHKATISEAIKYYHQDTPKGEFVIVIEGKSKEVLIEEQNKSFESITMEEHLTLYLKQGLTKKEAIKEIAKDRSMNKRTVYNHFAND